MPKSQLLELYAHGLGVIQEARLEFGSGFNVLTGETGAGKTLLLGALDLLSLIHIYETVGRQRAEVQLPFHQGQQARVVELTRRKVD